MGVGKARERSTRGEERLVGCSHSCAAVGMATVKAIPLVSLNEPSPDSASRLTYHVFRWPRGPACASPTTPELRQPISKYSWPTSEVTYIGSVAGGGVLSFVHKRRVPRPAPRRAAIMTCLRCLRLMIEDQFLDLESPYGQMWATSLRCANCGHVHSSAIEQPRLARLEKVAAS